MSDHRNNPPTCAERNLQAVKATMGKERLVPITIINIFTTCNFNPMQLEPDPETENWWIYISLQQFPTKTALLDWSFFFLSPPSPLLLSQPTSGSNLAYAAG